VLKVKIITSNGDIGFPVQVFWFYYSKALFKYLSFQYFDILRTDEGYFRNATFAQNFNIKAFINITGSIPLKD
jgi:hypothetical protein